MAINVICPGCHARFKVSDAYGGKTGPCPKCKHEIRVPTKKEEVVIETPDQYEGVKDAAGNLVLKPIERTETRFSLVVAVMIVVAFMLLFATALIVRLTSNDGMVPPLILVVGAIILAPPLVVGGYTFLRDAELEPHQGASFWIRTIICSVIYVLLWGGYAFAVDALCDGHRPELWQLIYLMLPILLVGSLAALASFDLDPTNAFFHYTLYLGVTVALRVTVGLPPF